MVLLWTNSVAPLAKMPPPAPPLSFPLISLVVMVVRGPAASMPPPLPVATLLRNRLLTTVSVPPPFWSPKPPPEPLAKLFSRVQLTMVTVPLPALPMPPPTVPVVSAWLLLMRVPVTVRLAVWKRVLLLASVTAMASSQMPAPWLTQVLPVMTVPVLMTTLPEPSSSMPPPASPAWLLLMMLLLMVNFHGSLTVFSMETPPPSAVAVLPVRTTLLRTRLALPWSRMPPPLPLGPSGTLGSLARPLVMVKPVSVTVNGVVGLLGSKLGLMSNTRDWWLPLTVTAPWLRS